MIDTWIAPFAALALGALHPQRRTLFVDGTLAPGLALPGVALAEPFLLPCDPLCCMPRLVRAAAKPDKTIYLCPVLSICPTFHSVN